MFMRPLHTYILNEAMSELYHFTNGVNVANMLRHDSFKASKDDGYQPVSGYGYFMSTTRQQFAGTGYPAAMMGQDICKIVLDGKALNSRYKMVPIDWGRAKMMAIRSEWPAGPDDWDMYKDERLKQTNVESEDRVLLKTATIPNFHRYIKKIYIDTNTIDPKDADDIIQCAEKLGVEVDVTCTTKEFMMAH